jgi:hypothetical protein
VNLEADFADFADFAAFADETESLLRRARSAAPASVGDPRIRK